MATISERLRTPRFYNSGVSECGVVWSRLETHPLEIEAADTIDALVKALEEVNEWIGGWSPDFEQDDEWPATKAKIKAALAMAKGQTP